MFRPLECTATSMAFFDKLQDAGAERPPCHLHALRWAHTQQVP